MANKKTEPEKVKKGFIPGTSFPDVVMLDNQILVEPIDVISKQQQRLQKSNIVTPGQVNPKNIMDIERQKAMEMSTYEQAKDKILSEWDDHPFQGRVVAVGPGTPIEEDVKIPMPLKPGDHVYVRARAGEAVIFNHNFYWLLRTHDVYFRLPRKS